MLMVCHHLDRNIPEDLSFAESRIRAETVAAEDILQDIGAISMISSDSQAMGRVGEVVSRTWRTASKLREFRGPLVSLDDCEGKDNGRVKRYVAKYTINPYAPCLFSLDFSSDRDSVAPSPMGSATSSAMFLLALSPISFFGNQKISVLNPRWCSNREWLSGRRFVACWSFYFIYFVYKKKIRLGYFTNLDWRCQRVYPICPTILLETHVGFQTRISSAQFSCVCIPALHFHGHYCILWIIKTSRARTWVSISYQEGYEMEWCDPGNESWPGELWSSCGWGIGRYSSCWDVTTCEAIQSVLNVGGRIFGLGFLLSLFLSFCFVKSTCTYILFFL